MYERGNNLMKITKAYEILVDEIVQMMGFLFEPLSLSVSFYAPISLPLSLSHSFAHSHPCPFRDGLLTTIVIHGMFVGIFHRSPIKITTYASTCTHTHTAVPPNPYTSTRSQTCLLYIFGIHITKPYRSNGHEHTLGE